MKYIQYTSAIRLNPSYEEAIHNRGNIYWSQEKYALAIADLNRAVQLAPNEAAAFADRGNLVLDWIDWNTARSEYDTAYADLQKALRKDEVYLKIVLLDQRGYGILVSHEGAKPYAIPAAEFAPRFHLPD